MEQLNYVDKLEGIKTRDLSLSLLCGTMKLFYENMVYLFLLFMNTSLAKSKSRLSSNKSRVISNKSRLL